MSEVTFAAHLLHVKEAVDRDLERRLAERVSAAVSLGPEVAATVRATSALALRGGKRLRAALVAAAYVACGGEGGALHVTSAGVALELLQAYLLVHDDWMDEDDERRGGPAVHAELARTFGSAHLGNASAVLGGDWVGALAYRVLLETPVPAERARDAALELARVEDDVVLGQLLDLHGAARDPRSVERTHDLKTGSYSVRGPLAIGAILAGATEAQRSALARYAAPLGVAFQLRDDVLGTFGDPRTTGKSSGGDVRQGKQTALIAELAGDAVAAPLLARALGKPGAAQSDLDALLTHMTASGARARVEARVDALGREALTALEGAPFDARGCEILSGAAQALVVRER